MGVAEGVTVEVTAVIPAEAALDFAAEGRAVIPAFPTEEGAVRILVGMEEGFTVGATMLRPVLAGTVELEPELDSES